MPEKEPKLNAVTPEEKKPTDIEGLLDHKMDFKLLRRLYAEVFRRCGLDESKMNFLERDRIRVMYEYAHEGRFDNQENIVTLGDKKAILKKHYGEDPYYEAKLKKDLEQIPKTFGNDEVLVLSVLTHEEGHAISHRECVGEVTWDMIGEERKKTGNSPVAHGHTAPGEPIFEQVGLHRTFPLQTQGQESVYKKNGPAVFHALNEAVNEKLARRITLRYLEESSDFDDSTKDAYRQSVYGNSPGLNYSNEVRLLDNIMGRIAATTGLSEEVVFEAFVRASLEGECFEDEMIQDFFKETFGPEFLIDLARLTGPFHEDSEELRNFVKKYKLYRIMQK